AAETCIYDSTDSLTTVDGSTHALGILPHTGDLALQEGHGGGSLGTVFNGARSVDGSNLFEGPDGTVTFPSGVREKIGANPYLEDTNGNQILAVSQGPLVQQFEDTLGRILPGIFASTGDPDAIAYGNLPTTTDTSGCTGPLPIASVALMNFPAFGGGSTPA